MIDKKKEISIANSFKKVGILPNDVVMIHGDAGVAANLLILIQINAFKN